VNDCGGAATANVANIKNNDCRKPSFISTSCL
jgi:hypothetical protein